MVYGEPIEAEDRVLFYYPALEKHNVWMSGEGENDWLTKEICPSKHIGNRKPWKWYHHTTKNWVAHEDCEWEQWRIYKSDEPYGALLLICRKHVHFLIITVESFAVFLIFRLWHFIQPILTRFGGVTPPRRCVSNGSNVMNKTLKT